MKVVIGLLLIFLLIYCLNVFKIAESFTNISKPKCACIYDIDSTLTTGNCGGKVEAIDARASAESCIKAGCAIGVATGGSHCTQHDENKCQITKDSLGFNILDPNSVTEAEQKICTDEVKKMYPNCKITTGQDWVKSHWNKARKMDELSDKLDPANKSCGILFDDNILESCGSCDSYKSSNQSCPTPWGTYAENLGKTNQEVNKKNYKSENVKPSYKCAFDGKPTFENPEKMFPDPDKSTQNYYTWVPAREMDTQKEDLPFESQMGGTSFNWNNGAQNCPSEGITQDYWNKSVASKDLTEMQEKCNIILPRITDPILDIPNTGKKEKCQWEKPVLCPSGNSTQGAKECGEWAQENCPDKKFSEMYCRDNNYCHFKPEDSDSDNSETLNQTLKSDSKVCSN
jgi:hypothetical protein